VSRPAAASRPASAWPEVPRQVIVPAAVVTKENVAEYKQSAFN
jgi:hypothetical protein